MCTGLEIAAIAAMGAGSYMQSESVQAKQRAQSRAAEAEAMRQAQIDDRKQQEFQAALQGFDRESQQANVDQATAERKAMLDAATADAPQADASYQTSAADNAPKVVKDHLAQRQSEANDFVAMLGDARARMGAWSEGMFTPAQQLGDLGFDLNELNTQAARSARTGQLEAQTAAQNAGNGQALLGNLLTTGGTVGLAGGFGGTGGQATTLAADQVPAASAGLGQQFAQNYYDAALTPTPLAAAGRVY